MAERTENGAAIVPLKHSRELAVPVDIIGKVSRVSISDVVRVLAAIDIVSRETGVDAAELVKLDNVPLGQATQTRARATELLFAQIRDAQADTPEGNLLRLRNRARPPQA